MYSYTPMYLLSRTGLRAPNRRPLLSDFELRKSVISGTGYKEVSLKACLFCPAGISLKKVEQKEAADQSTAAGKQAANHEENPEEDATRDVVIKGTLSCDACFF
jgi:hypothetical protein